ncbi:MAG: GNAT family N-acetyltransferase [Hyphomicrobiaceae bacterium]
MTADGGIRITPAASADDLADVATLFRAYADSLDVDLCFQGFEAELAGLPGKYAPSEGGALLVARRVDSEAIGCVALRRIDRAVGEMKRLYVSPEGRGSGLGRRLADAICDEARRLGYAEIRLDSLPSMTTAIAMYRTMGFQAIAPYYDTPVAGTAFLGLRLDR